MTENMDLFSFRESSSKTEDSKNSENSKSLSNVKGSTAQSTMNSFSDKQSKNDEERESLDPAKPKECTRPAGFGVQAKMTSFQAANSSDSKDSDGVSGSKKSLGAASVFFKESDGISFREDESGQEPVKPFSVDTKTNNIVMDESDSGFFPQEVEFADGTGDASNFESTERENAYSPEQGHDEKSDSGESAKGKTIIITYPKLTTTAADKWKFSTLCSRFEKGNLVQALDESGNPLLSLLQIGSELMAYMYLGKSLSLRVPARVGKLPVKYIHPDFISGGLNPFKGAKAQNIKDNFSTENIANVTKEQLKTSLKGITEIILPEGLTMLPENLFYHCMMLKSVVIPSTVTAVSVNTFYGSCFEDIWFNGPCPIGFKNNSELPKGVRVHFKKQYESTFVG